MKIPRKRKLVRFLKIAEPLADALGLLAICLFFISFVPLEVFTAGPATGGDTGSHFWPLVSLVEHGLPEGRVRMWNPGNMGGEPHLVHYFPLPYFVMALLSLIMPLGAAFNVGSLLPLLLLPVAVYLCVRSLGARFPAPIFAACASLLFLYNESFVMWGGNTLSTMAGQFAHVYAFVFLFLSIGALAYEIRRQRFPVVSALCLACVCISHAYVMVGLPLVILSLLFFYPYGTLRSRLKTLATSSIFSGLLSLWFLIPMVRNAPWTTAYFFFWQSKDLLSEVFPGIFYPLAAAAILSLVALFFVAGRGERRRTLLRVCLWTLPAAGYLIYYWIFPLIGLVDARAFPHTQILLCVLSGIIVGQLFRHARLLAFLSTVPVVSLSIYWSDLHAVNFPGWIQWNYSGWTNKPAYNDLIRLADHIRGDFSMPRVIYEHNAINNRAGTERVFEMLPYFANRATLESVYNQASILAPAAFLLQAEVSKTPSCPFSQYDCAPYNLDGARDRLELLGVGELILTTPELIAQGREADYLSEDGTFGQWTLFKLKEQPPLVELFKEPPLLNYDTYWGGRYFRRGTDAERQQGQVRVPVNQMDWKELFYYWLKAYTPPEKFVIVDRGERSPYLEALKDPAGNAKALNAWYGGADCHPQLDVQFNRMTLTTPCPGKTHLLKFAYHGSWRTDSGDPLFLVSPGFIAIVPSKERVVLTFGAEPLWKISGVISVISLFLLFGGALWQHGRFRFRAGKSGAVLPRP